jgi:hypothetical protein
MSLKPLPAPPDLPIEHFRCVPRAETLLRTACAGNYARVAVSGKAPGNDKHCSGCAVGAVHATGRVPTHKAPAVDAPADAETVERRVASVRPAAPAEVRYARCEVGGHAFQCAAKGRMPKRCGEHRGYVGRWTPAPAVSPKAPVVHETPASVQKRPPSVQAPARIDQPLFDPDSLLSVRLLKNDRARIDAAAIRAGLSTSEWARFALLGAATIVGVR